MILRRRRGLVLVGAWGYNWRVDGMHDLGGRQGFGPVVVEPGEPGYHARWEAATRLLFRVILPKHLPNGSDGVLRHAIERMDPALYLSTGYYGRWVTAAATLAVESGIVSHTELEEQAGGPFPLSRPVTAPAIDEAPQGRSRFAVGDRVRVRGGHPRGHTRCPWYIRGHEGVISRIDGAFSLPDVEAHSDHRVQEATYSVRFEGDDLWNDDQPGVTVNVDLWDSYLEPA
ncbi:MAG TPA: nitrile hydratase subunit beta [Mycobacteriales bacterium]|nr:nitrile hydratase subunit beta [Mycobacteriales bacterium]